MLTSKFVSLTKIKLPAFMARQKYMHSFDLSAPKMAVGFEDYLEPVVQLCKTAGAIQGIAHMTVDEKIIQPGNSQRKPKPRIKSWSGKRRFLKALSRIESVIEDCHIGNMNYYKGFSPCRLCLNTRNGSKEYMLGGWLWPQGFAHYVQAHNIRPSREFIEFVRITGRSGGLGE